MPLPFIPLILVAGSVTAAAFGAFKGYQAKESLDKAEQLRNDAQKLAEDVQHKGETAYEELKASLTSLGEAKLHLSELGAAIAKQLISNKNQVLYGSQINEALFKSSFIYSSCFNLSDVVLSTIGALGGGFASIALALGGVALFGTASTGAIIGTLSGQAFINALLAWFGGGAIAAGGLGMAAGAAVLSGLFIGPAILIGGWILSSKAEEALEQARDRYREIKSKAIEANKISDAMTARCVDINKYTALINRAEDTLGQLWDLYDEERDFSVLPAMNALLAYNNVLMLNLPLFNPNDDPKNPKFNINPKFARFMENLDLGLDQIDFLLTGRKKSSNDSSSASLPVPAPASKLPVSKNVFGAILLSKH